MALLSIEIPTYNEADNLPIIVERIEALKMDVEIIVVDDNSPDGTSGIAQTLAEKYGNVKIVKRPSKMGITSAIREGLSVAEGEYVAVMDCDLQHPPEFLPTMMKEAEKGADVVIASRYVKGGSSSFSLARRIVSRTATGISHLLLGKTGKIADPLSGYFIFRKDVIDPADIKSNSYKVLLEILVRGRVKTVKEVPYTFCERVNGKSKFGFTEVMRYLHLVLQLSGYRALKLAVAGLAGLIVNEGILFMLEPRTPLLAASAMAVEASIIASFVMHSLWPVNGKSGESLFRRLARYNTLTVLGALTNIAVLGLLVFIHFEYLAANFVGIMLGLAANYTGSEELLWT